MENNPSEQEKQVKSLEVKYLADFLTGDKKNYSVISMENYAPTEEDIFNFSQILDDKRVYEYITRESIKKWGHQNSDTLARDILENSSLRWREREEIRFLLRDENKKAIGMIGVTIGNKKSSAELWYYKTSSSSPCMYEALQLVFSFLKQEDIQHLSASYELSNVRSKEILLQLGFLETRPGYMELQFL